jgi:alkaline phosphatase
MKTTVTAALVMRAFRIHRFRPGPAAGSSQWLQTALPRSRPRSRAQPNTNRAKNVILLVADGNGVGTNYATRLFVGQQGRRLGEDYVLPYETPESLHRARQDLQHQRPDPGFRADRRR